MHKIKEIVKKSYLLLVTEENVFVSDEYFDIWFEENFKSFEIDIYSGDLNTERIKQYKKLAELYNIQESTVRDIFCKGADWALKL